MANMGGFSDCFTFCYHGARLRGGNKAGAAVVFAEGVELWVVREGLVDMPEEAAIYQALILGLKLAREDEYVEVSVCGYSEVIHSQITGEDEIHDPILQRLHSEAVVLIQGFSSFRPVYEGGDTADSIVVKNHAREATNLTVGRREWFSRFPMLDYYFVRIRHCKIYYSGVSLGPLDAAGAGVVIKSDDGISYHVREGLGPPETANFAVWSALYQGLRFARQNGLERVVVYGELDDGCFRNMSDGTFLDMILMAMRRDRLGDVVREANILVATFKSFRSRVIPEDAEAANRAVRLANAAVNLDAGQVIVEEAGAD